MEYLGDQNIGLDGVVAQQKNYQKSGFKLVYRNIRYEGRGVLKIKNSSINIVEVAKIPFDHLIKYDTQFFPAPRPEKPGPEI